MFGLLRVLHCPGVGEDDAAAAAAAVTEQQEVVVVEQESEEQVVEAQTAVVSVVEADSQEVLHQVHFTMEVDGTTQEQQVGIYFLDIFAFFGKTFPEALLPLTLGQLVLLLLSLLLSSLRRKP